MVQQHQPAGRACVGQSGAGYGGHRRHGPGAGYGADEDGGEQTDRVHPPQTRQPPPGSHPPLDPLPAPWPVPRLMKTADFDFDLPEDRIALRPADPRDSARLLVVRDGALDDRTIRDLPDFLRPGDALVFNDTRVIPARLSGVRQRHGLEGETLIVDVEATMHHRDAPDVWSAFMKPGKRIKPGDRIRFGQGADAACDLGRLDATVTAKGDDGLITLRAQDVLTADHPWFGTWTSASLSTGVDFNNPLPLHFEWLALFVKPFGVAAGFDKDAVGVDGLHALGFGHVEVGTVTAIPQTGNPKPRLFRLIPDRAVVNRMGFNNHGSYAAAGRLERARRRRHRTVLGVNIGKSRIVDVENAVVDYVTSTRLLAPVADYLVVNVSSSERSGAILTSRGVSSAASFTAVSRGLSDSTACRLRRPGVFGDDTLTTR